MLENTFWIGVIGHREIFGHDECCYAQMCCHAIFSALKSKYSSVRAVSAIAKGADSLFAQMAISVGIPVDVVLPFDGYESDFPDDESYTRYAWLRKISISESKVRLKERSYAAYRKSMQWVIFKSNLIVAIWDGKESGSKGGTWDAVTLCKILRKQFIHVNIVDKTMHFYSGKGVDSRQGTHVKINSVARWLDHVNK